MKVLGISGSMRKDGNTADLVNVILERCQVGGIKTEFISLAGKKIHPCLGCEKCKKEKWCVIENDDWGDVIQKVLDCDVLIIGSPTYFYDVCGHLKNFIDRTYLSTMTGSLQEGKVLRWLCRLIRVQTGPFRHWRVS